MNCHACDLLTVCIRMDKDVISKVKTILVSALIMALFVSGAVDFVRIFSYAESFSDTFVPAEWIIRNDTADSHPLEAVKDEEDPSVTITQHSVFAQNSGVRAWDSIIRLILKALLAAGLWRCCILAARLNSPVRWISSTCSHSYIISYIIRLFSYDRSSLRW
ncbi:MAG: hypothetical protein IJW67_04160 [Blautia sp.]|nr:hypothetical protein [Blautia sp.]